MAEEKHVYESDVIALPPLRLVLGDVPVPDPDRQNRPEGLRKTPRDMRTTVQRLIAHLEEKKK